MATVSRNVEGGDYDVRTMIRIQCSDADSLRESGLERDRVVAIAVVSCRC